VVGGGPAGLAAALMLSKRGYKDIHVIEKNSPAFFEVDKAYL
jgi:2-polyprenyl-6-methoxyphenol hydroxylase-like FAD-dependent oxidoreductase